MHFKQALLPGYGWIFPEAGDLLNAGVFVDTQIVGSKVRPLFDRFVEENLLTRATLAQVSKVQAHKIACQKTLPTLGAPGILWAGESAGLASQATGEGIWHAIESGIAAAQAIGTAFGRNDARVLSTYQRTVRLRLQPFLASSWLFTRFAKHTMFPNMVSLANSPPLRAFSHAVLERA
jgi:flavin-dependent dehydrogenase